MKIRKYTGYLRTEESIVPKLIAIFVYKRKDKKHGVVRKVEVTLKELS